MSKIENCKLDLIDAIQSLPSFANETIVGGWVPDVDRKELTKRHVYVDPEARETKLIARGVKQTVVVMVVAFVAPVTQGKENDIVEEEQLLIDELIDQLLGIRVGTRAKAMVEQLEQSSIAVLDHWKDRAATSVLRVRMII